jgi:hypothetical protein
MQSAETLSQNPVAVAATESEANTFFKQMAANLAAGIARYGSDEAAAIWQYHTELGLIHGQAINHSKGQSTGQLLSWLLNETRPYVLADRQPKNRSLAEYAYQLLYDVLDHIGLCLPGHITAEKYEAMFEHLDSALDELGEMLIATNELSYVDLYKRLGVLATIREAIAPDAVLGKVLDAHSSQEV